MKHLFGFMGGFSRDYLTGGPIYVIIIQNETNDIRELERPCLLL
jgi:hypothetical protein